MKNALKIMMIGIPLLLLVTGTYYYLSLPDVAVLKTKNPAATALMLQRFRQARRAKKPFRLRQQWVSLPQIPQLLKDAIRVSEDASFYQHHGVDFDELIEALKKDWQKRSYQRGASTITQQLAKNLYLSTEKSILRKLKEYFIARRLEKSLGKKRIFELYLNVIELGPGIFGVQAAAQYYFHKNVDQLNLEQIVRLTAVIPRPLKTSPTADSPWLKWKAQWILNTLRKYHYITPAAYDAAITKFR